MEQIKVIKKRGSNTGDTIENIRSGGRYAYQG